MKRIQNSGICLLISLCLAAGFWGCDEKSDAEVLSIDPNGKGNLTLEFDNIVGGTNLALGGANYKNSFGEEYTVDVLNYFISNVALKKADGTTYKVPNSYYLIRESDVKTQSVKLTDVPQGDYTGVNFTIGVDSAKSVSPVTERMGALDPGAMGQAADMYWSWNSGYIFVRLEGTSSAVPADRSHQFAFHTGGFGGMTGKTVNNLRSVSLTMPTTATVRALIAPTVHLLVDVAKVMDGPTKISLATLYQNPAFRGIHMPEAALKLGLTDNQKTMFTVDHVHNDPK